MSDSEVSATSLRLPLENDISKCLYRVVRDALKKGAEITTRQARSQAESELGLDAGFFKNDPTWNAKSKRILAEAVEASESPEKPAKAVMTGSKRKSDQAHSSGRKRKKVHSRQSEANSDEDSEAERNDEDVEPHEPPVTKHKSTANGGSASAKSEGMARKHSKARHPPEVDSEDEFEIDLKQSASVNQKSSTSALDSSDDPEEVQDETSDLKTNGASRVVGASTNKEDDGTENTSKAGPERRSKSGTTGDSIDEAQDESDYSIVFDEEPSRKGRGKKTASAKATDNTSTKPTKPKPVGKDLSPEDEEVKRLQGWLVKCGIRKLWHKELADCSNAKQKINHLKAMLTGAGMTGRYSTDKARAIKEARELADEIEAAQEFNKRWGEKSGDEVEEEESEADSRTMGKSRAPPPRGRRLPKGLVDFGDDDDDDEDD
nr:hira-interacting protein 3 [Quercus suber]